MKFVRKYTLLTLTLDVVLFTWHWG